MAIARAFLKQAPVVVLDEATSALDNKSEEIVQQAIDNLMKDKTVFVIAHRLSTIKNANRIAVINEGQLAELGTHEELMALENGQYRRLYEMQFKNPADGGYGGRAGRRKLSRPPRGIAFGSRYSPGNLIAGGRTRRRKKYAVRPGAKSRQFHLKYSAPSARSECLSAPSS